MERSHHIRRPLLAAMVSCVLVLSCSQSGERPEPAGISEAEDSGASPTGHMPPLHQGVIHGTKENDAIEGTAAGEKIDALAGRDRVTAGAGDDVLDGGPGADVLKGGPGDDTYELAHHGGGGDVLQEEGGTDTLELAGRVDASSIKALRHGDDLLVRWNRESPLDAVLIRSWFADTKYQIEQLRLADGTVLKLQSLAAGAPQAGSEELVHFPRESSGSEAVAPQ